MSLTQDQQDALNLHNQARSQAPGSRPPLTWSTSLTTEALTYAQKLASCNTMKHASQRAHGENLACSNLSMTLAKATQYWIEEKKDYHGEKVAGSGHRKWGHYTQVIWPNATRIGMGIAVSRSGVTYVVARYDKIQMKGKYPYDGSWSNPIPRNNPALGPETSQPQPQPRYQPHGQRQAQPQPRYPRYPAQRGLPQNQRQRSGGMRDMIENVIHDFEEIDGRRHGRDAERGRNGPEARVGATEVIGVLRELWDRHQERNR